MKQKHIVVKKKNVFEGPGPKKRKPIEKGSSSDSKRRRKEEEKKDRSRKQRNEILKTLVELVDCLIPGFIRNLAW